MIRMPGVMIIAICLAATACWPIQRFPTDITEGADKNFDFTDWRSSPNAKTGQKVQLGGRIVQADLRNKELVIIATQLQIVEQPAYGPRDTGRRSGEFAIFYAGTLDPKWLKAGNRLIVIGTTGEAKAVVVDDVKRNLPSLTAQCVHIWNTGGKDIAEFPYNAGGGYEPLQEDTYCVTP
ncbi:MAG: putative Outer rane lipoprotein Slp family [Nitrospira sp.]|jgi:starvation-inducible outer membrane lipoprotein|nr:putative Outer rane lipoprotein Slp family [Nitrospira sp.]